jgi:hypothetical protein
MVDALIDGTIYDLFKHNIRTAGHEDIIFSLRVPSEKILPLLAPQQFDWVYIDGKHAYDNVVKDIAYAMPLLKEGGILCGDDLEEQWFEVDTEEANQKKQIDFICDTKTGKGYHPGVTLACSELLGEVSVWNGFWAMQKLGQEWRKVELPKTEESFLLPCLQGFAGWSNEEQQEFINWLDANTDYNRLLSQMGEFYYTHHPGD